MKNYIYIENSDSFNAYNFMQKLVNNNILSEYLIEINNYIGTEAGYFIYNNTFHRIWFNVVKDDKNYIVVTKM